MKYRILFLLIICNQLIFAQGNQLWKSYYSYNEIVDVESSLNTVYAATSNSIFYKNLQINDLNIINSVNGFKPETITAIHHSETFNKTIAANSNGLLLIVNADGSVTTKVDIIEEVPVAPNIKRINDLYEYNGKLYISCDYGISVLNLATSEFETTYFIGTAGEEVRVLQTTVLNDELEKVI
uniref:PorZ beta-propeller-like domain-containing protein n=1 Tax=Flavobacterium sp. TaxID=239 RepID=UPI00404B7073